MKRFYVYLQDNGLYGVRSREGHTVAWDEKRPSAYKLQKLWETCRGWERDFALHFVGFRDESYHSACAVFGFPDVVHRVWDQRARAEVGPEDVVVFCSRLDRHDRWEARDVTGEPVARSWDDSHEDIRVRGPQFADR